MDDTRPRMPNRQELNGSMHRSQRGAAFNSSSRMNGSRAQVGGATTNARLQSSILGNSFAGGGGASMAFSELGTSFASGIGTQSISNNSSLKSWGDHSVKFQAKNFVAKRGGSLEDYYYIGDMIGQGGFGCVYGAQHIDTGAERAIKVMGKFRANHAKNERIVREFNIVKDLDHPNILRVYELFEDDEKFYIVTDIYRGGELYDEIDEWGNFTEADTAVLMRNVLSCINYCHKKNLVHGDMKLENILLEATKRFDDLKIIDFGQSCFCGPGQKLHEIQGSTYYMAPQVFKGSYTSKCDVWACGVVAFVCLSGQSPFDGESEEDVIRSILRGQYTMHDEDWDGVSDEAKDFVMWLLTYEEEARPTAEEALTHPWLKHMQSVMEPGQRKSTKSSLAGMRNFQSNTKLKQAVCSLIASQFLNKHEKQEIDNVFRSLDIDCDGKLTREDIRQSYKQFYGQELSENDITEMFRQVNFSGSGDIEYSEFAVAVLMEKRMIDEHKLLAAYRVFDKEDKGYISIDNIKHVLQLDDGMDKYVVKKIIRQVDEDGDGRISFEEFKIMMYGDNEPAQNQNKSVSLRKGSTHSLLPLGSLSTAADENSYADHPPFGESSSTFAGDASHASSVFSKISEKIVFN